MISFFCIIFLSLDEQLISFAINFKFFEGLLKQYNELFVDKIVIHNSIYMHLIFNEIEKQSNLNLY